MSRHILITGGAGFLGTHLSRSFRRVGVQVRLLDLEGSAGGPRDPGVEYVGGDVRDPRVMADALDGVDVVVHAAFASPRQPAELIRSVNVGGVRSVCEQALIRGVRRVIVISSAIVANQARTHPLFRDSPLTRLDLYRASRVEAEALAGEYARRGLSVAIVRPKTLVGPERVAAFAIVFEWIRLGRPVVVLGSGRNRYQLLDARDLGEGIRLLAGSAAPGVFSFGAATFRSVREDLQTLLDHARTGARLHFIPGRAALVGLRAMELANLVPLSEWHYMSARGEDSTVDISRAERELGWRPERSNTQSLVEAYDWYVESWNATGAARSTHPVPLAHRALKCLTWLLQR